MKITVNFDDENASKLAEAQKATGLDLAGIFNEAMAIYLRTVEARQAGKELAHVSEGKKTYMVLSTPGLKNIPLGPR